MPDFIRWLLGHPIILLVVIAWVFSSIARSMQKAARKAQQERGGARRASTQGGAGRRPQQPDPADIAREIRRAMGLEPAEQPAPRPAPRVAAPRRVDPGDIVPEPVVVRDDEHLQQGRLRERMAARDARERGTDRFGKREAHLGERIHDRHIELHVPADEAGASRRRARRGRLLDLSRPASAIVALEVLGKPIALRDCPLPRDV